jgi:hypothetical protein
MSIEFEALIPSLFKPFQHVSAMRKQRLQLATVLHLDVPGDD